jgi:hypothetical protein
MSKTIQPQPQPSRDDIARLAYHLWEQNATTRPGSLFLVSGQTASASLGRDTAPSQARSREKNQENNRSAHCGRRGHLKLNSIYEYHDWTG